VPTFDFQCKKCSAVFEFSRPFGSEEKPACPACKSKRTEKLLTPPAVQFKGSGFYKTDSAKTVSAKKKEEVKESTKVPETKSTEKVTDKKTE
jgi:putative FmdB family regulatory protein